MSELCGCSSYIDSIGNGRECYYNPDVFSGYIDMVYLWYVADSKMNFNNENYIFVKHTDPIGAEELYNFDPVLKKCLND